MTDIIVISPQTFLEQKKSEANANILKKYQEIYAKNACFTSVKYEPSVFHQNTKSSHFTKKQTVAFPPIKKKDPNKAFTGIMNVINTTNYPKVLIRIKLIISSSYNLSTMIKTIIKTCCRDTFYLQIHLKLLTDIIAYVKDDTEKIYTIIQEFTDEFIAEKEWTKLSVEYQGKGYIEFCDKQKWKSAIISKNIVLLEFMNHFHIKLDVHKYTKMLEEDLLHLLNEDDQDGITVVITMLIDIAKVKSSYVKDIDINNLFTLVSSKKNLFILEELSGFVNQSKGAYDRMFSKPSIKAVEGMYGSLKDMVSF